jgi:uroporphyrinogen decarboxylase
MKQMSRRERVLAAVNRQPVDRMPYAVWRHFPTVDHSPAGLAQATLRFHERYGSDFLKITPRGGYAVEAWGCVEGDAVREDGHRPCARCAVRAPDDWKKIRALDPGAAPGYAEEIETIIRLGFDRRIGDAPVVPTLFSPLSVAKKLSGDRLPSDLREHPEEVTGALEAITETLIKFAHLALTEGVSGIFYSIQAASRSANS